MNQKIFWPYLRDSSPLRKIKIVLELRRVVYEKLQLCVHEQVRLDM